MSEKVEIASWWLARGFWLLPVQHNSKRLVQGFGQYQKKLKLSDELAVFFGGNSLLNLAVVAHQAATILDFDNPALYDLWAEQHPEAAKTYTERTPRGGAHVFAWGTVPGGLSLVDGVELKRVCVVSPSAIDGKQYTRGQGEILDLDIDSALSNLAKVGTPTPYLLRTRELQRKEYRPAARPNSNESLVERLKREFDCIQVLSAARPGYSFRPGRGGFVSTFCPFHKAGHEKEPSFWINTNTNLWGCHACPAHGDVINLWARLRGVTVQEAIKAMSAEVVK